MMRVRVIGILLYNRDQCTFYKQLSCLARKPVFPRFNISIFRFLFLFIVMIWKKRAMYNRARKSMLLCLIGRLYHVIEYLLFISITVALRIKIIQFIHIQNDSFLNMNTGKIRCIICRNYSKSCSQRQIKIKNNKNK